MKHYAVLTDTVREEPFGFVIKDGNYNICYGLHSFANEWAELYNSGESKSLEEHLPSDVIVSQFGPLSESTKIFLDGAVDGTSQDIPMPSSMRRTDSQWLKNTSKGPQLKDRRLDQIHSATRQIAVDYKACAFLADSKRSSVLLKTRLSNAGFNRGFTGFRSRGSDEGVYTDIAGGSSGMRRAAKELHRAKSDVLTHREPFFDSVEVKVLGSRIGGRGGRAVRRLARGAEMFDPDAVDADLDQLVQEGTPFERPKMPGKPNFIQGRRGVRSGRTGESGGPRDYGSDLPFHVSGPDKGKPRRQQGETDAEWAIRDPDGAFATQMRERAATSWGPTRGRGMRSQRNDPYAPENDPPPSVMRSDGSTEVDPEWLERHPEGVEGWMKANGLGGRRNERDDNLDVFDDILRDMDNAIRDSDTNKLDEIGEELDALGKIYSGKYGMRSGINPDWDMRDPDDRDDWLESEVGMGGDAVGKLHTDNVNMEIVPATDVLHGEEGWTVVGEYRDIDGLMGNEIGYLYDNPNFETPEEAAAWVDSLDESIEHEVGYDDWTPPPDRSGRSEVQTEAESPEGMRSRRTPMIGEDLPEGVRPAHWGRALNRRDNDSKILDASDALANAINNGDRDPDNLGELSRGLRDAMQGSRDISAAPSKRDLKRQQYQDGLRSQRDGGPGDWGRWGSQAEAEDAFLASTGQEALARTDPSIRSELLHGRGGRGYPYRREVMAFLDDGDASPPQHLRPGPGTGRSGMRSGRGYHPEAPRITEEQRREDGSYDPPPGYDTWDDFDRDWPPDEWDYDVDDDADIDTERDFDDDFERIETDDFGYGGLHSSTRSDDGDRDPRPTHDGFGDEIDWEAMSNDEADYWENNIRSLRESRGWEAWADSEDFDNEGLRSARAVPGRREGREDHQQQEIEGAERNDMSVPEYRKWREDRAASRQEEAELDDGVPPGTYDPPTRRQIRERDREALRQGAEREGVSIREYRAIREEREKDRLDLHWDDEDNSGLEEGQEGFARAGMASRRAVPGRREGREDRRQHETEMAESHGMSVPEYRKWREERAADRQEEAEMDDGVAPGTYDPPTRKQVRELDREALRQGAEREGVSVREYRAIRERREQANLDLHWDDEDNSGLEEGQEGFARAGMASRRAVPGRRQGREDHQQREIEMAERHDMSVPEYRKWREERAADRQEEDEMDDGVAPGTYDSPTRKQIRERDREALRRGAEREDISVREYRALREERQQANLDLHWDDEDNSGLEEGQEGFARAGMRSFREFDRAARENAPYDSPEGRRHRRETSEEWKRIVQFLMDDSQERHDLMARLHPDQKPEDIHDFYRVLSREEAIEELRRVGNNARVLGTGPGSPLGELRKRTAEKHRSRFGAGGAGYGMRSEKKPAVLRQGDKVTVNHKGNTVEGTVVRFGRGGASGNGVDSYVVSIPGEQRSIWKRPDEILEGLPATSGGLRSSGDNRYAHMTSSELMYWEEITDDILKGWEGAGPDVDIDAIEELRESIRTANLAQDVIDLGTPEEAENLADILRRHMTTIPDRNMGEARDVQGLVEIIENSLQSEGTWVSITLEERGYMLEDGPDDLRGGMRTGKQPSSRGGASGRNKKGRGPKPALSDQDYFKALRKLSPKEVRELAKEAGVDVSKMDHRQLMRSLSAGRPRPAIPNVPNSKIYVKPRSAPGQPVGGARSRMRAAATDRAATPQGLASRRRKLGYDAGRQPGSADGHIWDQLTPEQRELVAESAAERANWLLRRNFGTIGGKPVKGGGWLTKFISDIQDGTEVPARGETKIGVARPVDEIDVDTFRIETRRELEMFHRFINQERGSSGNLFALAGNAQRKKQLQQTMDFITAEFNMRQGNQGAGYYEALEHFHDKDLVGAGAQVSVLQIMRRKAKERGIADIPTNKKLLSPETYRAGPRNNPDGTPKMDPDTGKQVTSSQPQHVSTIFGFAGGLSGESYAEEGGATARTGRRKMRTDKEARRLADNDIFSMGERRKARRARAAARRGEGEADPGAQAADVGGPTLEERIRRAKRRARIRFGRKKDVSAMNEHVKKARETIRLKRSETDKVEGAGAVVDFPEWDVTEGLPVLDEAMEVALDGIAGRHFSRKRRLKKGDEGFDPDAIVPTAKEARQKAEAAAKEQGLSAAEVKKAGDKAAAANDIANDRATDHLQLVRDLYLNLGYNGSPLVVGDREAQALLDDGWTVVQRGLIGNLDKASAADQAISRRRALAYMDQAARFYSGGGGHGPLDDWARPYDPAIGDTDTRADKTGSLAGNYGIGTMGFIGPESKTVSHQKLIRISDEHEAVVEAIQNVQDETAEGGIKDVVDWLRKNPDASLIEELDRRQAAGKIKVQVRERTRKLTGADAGTGTAKGRLDTPKGTESLKPDWKKTEMGALYHQIIKKIEAAISSGDDKTAERLGRSLKFLDDMAEQHEHMIAPILGYDVIGRHSGVTKVLNRGAIVVHETPMGMGGTRISPDKPPNNEGDGVMQKVDELSPGHFEESIKEERAGRRFRGARAKKKKEKK